MQEGTLVASVLVAAQIAEELGVRVLDIEHELMDIDEQTDIA
jgi:hypothetical protein